MTIYFKQILLGYVLSHFSFVNKECFHFFSQFLKFFFFRSSNTSLSPLLSKNFFFLNFPFPLQDDIISSLLIIFDTLQMILPTKLNCISYNLIGISSNLIVINEKVKHGIKEPWHHVFVHNYLDRFDKHALIFECFESISSQSY